MIERASLGTAFPLPHIVGIASYFVVASHRSFLLDSPEL
jgi:hypothetical protein